MSLYFTCIGGFNEFFSRILRLQFILVDMIEGGVYERLSISDTF